MILVTVGTADFYRLIKKMDEIAGELDEEVIMQIGRTKYEPINAKYFRFVENIDSYMHEARLIVGHGGAGTIISALVNGKKLIAVPRLKILNEHFDDHQSELVSEFSNKNLIIGVFNLDDLKNILSKKDNNMNTFFPSKDLKNYLIDCIEHLSFN